MRLVIQIVGDNVCVFYWPTPRSSRKEVSACLGVLCFSGLYLPTNSNGVSFYGFFSRFGIVRKIYHIGFGSDFVFPKKREPKIFVHIPIEGFVGVRTADAGTFLDEFVVEAV